MDKQRQNLQKIENFSESLQYEAIFLRAYK